MPKRIGFIYEKVLTLENCSLAVLEGTENLYKSDKIKKIRANPEKYGQKVLDALSSGWVPSATREKVINEGTGRKIRRLKIPNTFDHICHVAIMRPIIPMIMRRFDFYSCGSVPGRGQKRVNNTLRSLMSGHKPPRYAAEADVYHAFESTAGDEIMKCLRRIIKDERYLQWHEMILWQMGGHLAIGFQPSHWYFNLLMSKVNTRLREDCHGLRLVQYMDNYVLMGNRKRMVHRAVRLLIEECRKCGLRINRSWQVYPTSKRAISMLSYRYFCGYTVLRKQTMYEISARIKTAGRKMCAHLCRGALSRIGILRHCNSYHYRKTYIYPHISIKKSKELISRADKKRAIFTVA